MSGGGALKRGFLFLVGAALCVALYRIADISLGEMTSRIVALPPYYITFFIAFDALYQYLRSRRWKFITGLFYPEAIFKRGFFLCHQFMSLSAVFLSASGTGMVLRVIAQKLEGSVSVKGASSILAAEYLVSMVVLAVMAVAMLAYLSGMLGLEAAALLCLLLLAGATGFVAIRHGVLLATLAGSVRWLLHRVGKGGEEGMALFERRVEGIESSRITRLFACSVVIYLLPPLYYFMLVRALEIDVTLLQLTVVFPVVYLASYLSFTPFGIGVREVGNAAALLILGASNEEALLFAAATRLFGDVTNFGLAAGGYLLWLRLRNAGAPAG